MLTHCTRNWNPVLDPPTSSQYLRTLSPIPSDISQSEFEQETIYHDTSAYSLGARRQVFVSVLLIFIHYCNVINHIIGKIQPHYLVFSCQKNPHLATLFLNQPFCFSLQHAEIA